MRRVLVVDDEPSMRELLAIMLRKEGFEVVAAESRAVAAAVLAQGPVDLVITDVKLPDGDGVEILRHVKAASPETVVIVMTAYGTTETAVAALKLGAHDYILKPFDVDELRIVVRNSLERQDLREENLRLKREFGRPHGLDQLVGVSPAMAALFEMIRSIAPTSSTVLVTGESGTGKELVARAIHSLSPRSDGPFVSVNCGALPDTLLESELFGHMKGAFTDAHQNKKGLFEAAHRGTLFLDEVGETSPPMQVKLLRALQEKKIRRVGGTEELEVDVRVISATNVPLESLVKERRFAREMGKNVVKVSEEAMAGLRRYSWPGNVRELENVIERAVALETTQAVLPERLPDSVRARGLSKPPPSVEIGEGFNLDEHLRSIESHLLMEALQQAQGDRASAARLLGVSPRSLRYLIQKHAVPADKN